MLRQLRPPHRLLVILEGESLFNDASALLVYRLAVGATLAGSLRAGAALAIAYPTPVCSQRWQEKGRPRRPSMSSDAENTRGRVAFVDVVVSPLRL